MAKMGLSMGNVKMLNCPYGKAQKTAIWLCGMGNMAKDM